MWQFAKAVEGMGAACRALDIPITGGNVSLYNETDGRAVLPTPVLGVVGLIEDAATRGAARRSSGAGDVVVLLGESRRRARRQRVSEGRCTAWCGACRPRSTSSARPRCSGCWSTAPRSGLIRVGARLRRGRPRRDAGRVLLRRGTPGVDVDLPAVDAGGWRLATSRRCSASRPPGPSSRWRRTRARGARRWLAKAGVPAAVIGRVGGGRVRLSIGGRRVIDEAVDDRRADLGWRDRVAVRADGCVRPYTETDRGRMFDKFREECGVFGIFGHPEAANLTYLGLYALQHRGQESAGIAVVRRHAHPRLARRWATSTRRSTTTTLAGLPGTAPSGTCATRRPARAAWPTRSRSSSTARTGSSRSATTATSINAGELRDALVRDGAIFQTSTDTEVVVHLFARSQGRQRRGGDHRRDRRRCAAPSRSC